MNRAAAARRSIASRPSIGSTAGVIQREALLIQRLSIDAPTLIMVEEGSKTLRRGDERWTIPAGGAVALSAGMVLDVVNRPGESGLYKARWLAWSQLPAVVVPPPADTRPLVAFDRAPAGLVDAAAHAVDAIARPERIPDHIAAHRMTEVLLWLSQEGFAGGMSLPGWSKRARDLLNAEVDAPWTLGRLAARLHVSPSTLRRHLGAEGSSFAELLADIRMGQALVLLQGTEKSVGHIARDVGYESASRFAIRFRKRFGFPPTAIRGHNRRMAEEPVPPPSAAIQTTPNPL